jgi:HD-GYP domain-containing protein (c-di-GMP phosphodiesterase class II)
MAVVEQVGADSDRVRAAEVVASLGLATDLGTGFPFEHGLEATLMSMRLADLLDVDSETARNTFYASLLMYVGCTTDAEKASWIFPGGMTVNLVPAEFGSSGEALAAALRAVTPPGGSFARRVYEGARRLPVAARFREPHYAAYCEVAEMLAERLGLPPSISGLFSRLTERWDGHGVLGRAAREEIPLSLRIARVARDAAYQRLIHDPDEVVDVIQSRAGKGFDPVVAGCFAEASGEVLTAPEEPVWERVLITEPKPWLQLSGDEIDRALGAIGMFSDLASPHLSGHSIGVAELAARTAQACGFPSAEVTDVRRAGLIHDLGRVAVHPAVWRNEGPLSADDLEQVRLHPYHTERTLDRSPFLARIAAIACCHHERLDGSGYHRRLGAASLAPASRLLAVVDAFCAMTEPRAHRPGHRAEEAAEILTVDAERGLHDPEMVAAVLDVVGLPPSPIHRPAGLTEREAEVLGLIARGLQTKQVARSLDISAKTADHHLQSAYRKIGVSTRAAATLFAMEHGLVS